MQVTELSAKVRRHLDEQTKTLPPDILGWMKQTMETHVHIFTGEALGVLKAGLVLDTNFALQVIRYYASGKSHMLFKMKKNPLFPIYAPKEMVQEVSEKLRLLAEQGYDKTKLNAGWRRLKGMITIRDVKDEKARSAASEIIGKRDPDDVSYVQLYIETGAAAILTNDNDFQNPLVRTFDLEGLQRVVAVFHRGVYSFFLLHDTIPLMMALVGKMLWAVVSAVFSILEGLLDLAVNVVSGTVSMIANVLSGFPDKVWVILGIIALVGGIIAVAHDGAREWIVEKTKELWRKVKPALVRVLEWITQTVDFVAKLARSSTPYAGVSIVILGEIHQNVTDLVEEVKKMNTAAA
jgi:predicted nucleic acid-binding protein